MLDILGLIPPLGYPSLRTSCAQLWTTFLQSGLTLQKPGLTPSAPLVPGLHLYDPDLTLRLTHTSAWTYLLISHLHPWTS